MKRFWDKVDKRGSDECWLWTEHCDKNGYGRYLKGLAHRVAYELSHGPITSGLYVLHTCDNPPCCNPAHLFEGTQATNMDDMMHKGRSSKGISTNTGTSNGMAKLNEAKVRLIRAELDAGCTYAHIKHKYHISQACVGDIKHHRTWRNI